MQNSGEQNVFSGKGKEWEYGMVREGKNVRIGCCGFPVSRKTYFVTFKTVELQQTFYQPPQLSTVKKWHEEAPPDFEYTLKAWQLITHEYHSPTYRKLKIEIPQSKVAHYGAFKPTDEVYEAWERTKEIADILHARVIVYQCPASFEPTRENKYNIIKFFSSVKRDHYHLVWEPRGIWGNSEIQAICRECKLIHGVDPFQKNSLYGKFQYYRLHGRDGYRYHYTREDLETLKGFIRKDNGSYIMFNNVFMYNDACTFKKIINENK